MSTCEQTDETTQPPQKEVEEGEGTTDDGPATQEQETSTAVADHTESTQVEENPNESHGYSQNQFSSPQLSGFMPYPPGPQHPQHYPSGPSSQLQLQHSYYHPDHQRHDALAKVHFYEAQMRDHAAAYASAAASAACAAAEIATSFVPSYPPTLPNGPSLSGQQMYPSPIFQSPVASPGAFPSFYSPNFSSPAHEHMNTSHGCHFSSPHDHQNLKIAEEVKVPLNDQKPPSSNSSLASSNLSVNETKFKKQRRMVTPGPSRQHDPMNDSATSNPTKRSVAGTRQLPQSPMMNQNEKSISSNNDWSHSDKRSRRRLHHNNNDHRGYRSRASPKDNAVFDGSSHCYHSNSRVKKKRSATANSHFHYGGNRTHHQTYGRGNNGNTKPFNPVGKTGISALYELCGKKHWSAPKFIEMKPLAPSPMSNVFDNNDNSCDGIHSLSSTHSASGSTVISNSKSEFVIAVEIDNIELGRGRGGTKKAAQQDACRKALFALFPGSIKFDANGLLLDLTCSSHLSKLNDEYDKGIDEVNNGNAGCEVSRECDDKVGSSGAALEDLASRLAIRGGTIYPYASTNSGVSSTSDDGDDDEYYASRGASVCNRLLHAMVQIDERIREPPTFTFDKRANPAEQNIIGGHSTKRKGYAGHAIASKKRNVMSEIGRSMTIHRCSFACTASLVLHTKSRAEDKDLKDQGNSSINDANQDDQQKGLEHSVTTKELLATGTGATKREARHVASAQLLAKLFPDCSGMVEVKNAAEAARERYAASKALKQSRNRTLESSSEDNGHNAADTNEMKSKDASIYYPMPNEPSIPKQISLHLFASTTAASNGESRNDKEGNSPVNGDDLAKLSLHESTQADTQIPDETVEFEAKRSIKEESIRQISKQKQLEESVDSALQLLNDCDEDGGRFNKTLDESDIGRTILKRATQDDESNICNLISKRREHVELEGKQQTSILDSTCTGPLSLAGESLTEASLLCGACSTIVILSRAIASLEEPPLGCAVLTLGFSLQNGRELRVAELAHEEHLPRERFLECLDGLANKMKCKLVVSSPKENTLPPSIVMTEKDMIGLLGMYAPNRDDPTSSPPTTSQSLNTLQPLPEEDCDNDSDKNIHKRLKLK